MRDVERAARPVSLMLVLGCLGATLILGSALKGPCANGSWADGRQYRLFCYSDIVPLLNTEQLAGNRLPFFERVPGDRRPVRRVPRPHDVLHAGRRLARREHDGRASSRRTWCCCGSAPPSIAVEHLHAGRQSAVVRVGAHAAHLRLHELGPVRGGARRPVRCWRSHGVETASPGSCSGLGAAAKFYPALLMVPLIAQRLSKREPDPAITIGWATVGTWFLVNLPFAIASPSSWSTFFRFNSSRTADFDSLWYIGCRHVDVGAICGHTSRINVASFTLFAVVVRTGVAVEAASRPGLRAMEPRRSRCSSCSCCPTRCTRRSTGCGCCRSSRSADRTSRRSWRSRSPTSRCS